MLLVYPPPTLYLSIYPSIHPSIYLCIYIIYYVYIYIHTYIYRWRSLDLQASRLPWILLLVKSPRVKVTSPGFNRLKNSLNFCWSLKSQKIFQNLPGLAKPHFDFGSFFHLAGEVRLHVLAQAVNSCWFFRWDPRWPSGSLVGCYSNQSCPFRLKKKKPIGFKKKSVHHALKS